MEQYQVQALNIFPIKSLRGISVTEMAISQTGFMHDREWVLIDVDGKFITQRQQPRMALINVVQHNTGVTISAKNTNSIEIPYEGNSSQAVNVTIWKDQCSGIVVDKEINRWFSNFLDVDCRLVSFDTSKIRPVDSDYSKCNQDQVHFADGFPFLLIGTASLEDLNRRLSEKNETQVPMIRFRPNIVIETNEPYIEDQWTSIRIGNVELDVVKPCSRCVIPTIDISTGVKAREPLLTLGSYRKRDGKIYFGQNLIHIYIPNQSIKVGNFLVPAN